MSDPLRRPDGESNEEAALRRRLVTALRQARADVDALATAVSLSAAAVLERFDGSAANLVAAVREARLSLDSSTRHVEAQGMGRRGFNGVPAGKVPRGSRQTKAKRGRA